MDLLGGLGGSNNGAPPQAAPRASVDDEWTFSSSVPDEEAELSVTNSSIKTVFSVKREGETELVIQSRISNNTAQLIADLTFQLAVTKVSSHFFPPRSPTGY